MLNSSQYRASVRVFDNRDNDLKTIYLNYLTNLTVIHMFNVPNLYDLYILFQSPIYGSFPILYFFVKHINEPLFLGTNLLWPNLDQSLINFSQNFTIYNWNFFKILFFFIKRILDTSQNWHGRFIWNLYQFSISSKCWKLNHSGL